MANVSNNSGRPPLSTRYFARGRSAVYQWAVGLFQRYQDDLITAEDCEESGLPHVDSRHLAGYHYPALASTTSHIRILILEPGGQSDPLHCRLEVVDLHSHPFYTALSYCWGDVSDKRGIVCEGYRAYVTVNLYHALLRLREPKRETRLWVDALCIDQRNLEERQQQIQLMRYIFQEAATCVAWLGTHTKNDGLAFRLLNTLYEYSASLSFDSGGDALIPGTTLVGKYATTPGQWKALSRLFERPWFERIWTLQEIVLPHHAVMQCGKFTFDADSFYTVVELLHHKGLATKMLRLQGGYLQSLKVAVLRKRISATTPDMDLFDTLRNTQDRNATNPRDKVIGMLGLCQVGPDLASQLNYQTPLRQLYLAVASHVLQSAEPFRLFHACSPTLESQDSTLILPSWVPNWNIRRALVPCIQEFEHNKSFHAGGSSTPSLRLLPSIQGMERLCVQGKIISTISDCVDKNSDDFIAQYKLIYGPGRLCCANINLCHLDTAFPWMYHLLNDDEHPTLEQYFLRICWGLTSASIGQQGFWDTMACTVTNNRADEAMRFQADIMQFATLEHTYDVASSSHVAFLQNLESWTLTRKFCLTTRDRIGWVPREAKNGDVVCVFQGSKLPYILRETTSDGVYTIVGHCYIHGIMLGETMDDERLILRDIILE